MLIFFLLSLHLEVSACIECYLLHLTVNVILSTVFVTVKYTFFFDFTKLKTKCIYKTSNQNLLECDSKINLAKTKHVNKCK